MRRLQYKIKSLVCTCLPMVLFVTNANAQMGVGTLSPANSVEIKTNATTTSKNVIIDNTGRLGVLVAAPRVAIDLRSGGTNGSVAIGYTDQSAAVAGKGALRYVNSPAIGVLGYLEYSDGSNWISFYPYGKPRIVVMARKATQDTDVFESTDPVGSGTELGPKAGLVQRRSSYLTNWSEVLDSDSGVNANNFNPVTGEFIAPRDGVYFATFTFALQNTTVETNTNKQTEAIWQVKDGTTNVIIQRVKTENGYSSDSGSGTLPVGSACTVSVYLKKGDKLRPFTWVTLQFNDSTLSKFNVTNSGEYNALTIVEQ
ncbi:hypothetical protein [Epilithonimonas sp.]|uniref:hypothetical protein n=1 Tax=Epilithonimonas sp. TaxID=2894511 RepID=UPI0028A1BC72|nr:hypothetical protein [Epilithonimonas sp.]